MSVSGYHWYSWHTVGLWVVLGAFRASGSSEAPKCFEHLNSGSANSGYRKCLAWPTAFAGITRVARGHDVGHFDVAPLANSQTFRLFPEYIKRARRALRASMFAIMASGFRNMQDWAKRY